MIMIDISIFLHGENQVDHVMQKRKILEKKGKNVEL